MIKRGRQLLATNKIDIAIQEFRSALDGAEMSRSLLDTISAGYHLGSSYVMKLNSSEAISILMKTIGNYKELKVLQSLDTKNNADDKQAYIEFEKTWKDAKFIVKNSSSCNQIKGYKLYYHMAKAFELSKQLRYAAEYYSSTIEELAAAGVRIEQNNQYMQNAGKFKTLANRKFANVVEKITLKRINGDANLRLAICLLKLNSEVQLESNDGDDDFLTRAVESIKISIEIYRELGNREMDLAYALIWFLRAHYLAGVMERSNLDEAEVRKVIEEAETCLKIDEAEEAFDDEVLKHKQKLKNELGFVAGQLSHEKAEDLLSSSIKVYNEKLGNKEVKVPSFALDQNSVNNASEEQATSEVTTIVPESQSTEVKIIEPTAQDQPQRKASILKKGNTPLNAKEKSWVYLQKARAENGLSEYYHNTGNKKGAFKILLQAAKDYGYAGNDRQRAKCLILAVENGAKFMLSTPERRKKHADVLQDMLDKALEYYNEYDLETDPIIATNVYQAYRLKSLIYEKCSDHEGMLEKAIKYCQKAYETFHQQEDLEKLTELIAQKAERNHPGSRHAIALDSSMLRDAGVVVNAPVSPRRGKIKMNRWKFSNWTEFLALVEDSIGDRILP